MRQVIDQIADSLIAYLEDRAKATGTALDDLAVKLLKQFKPWLVDLIAGWLEKLLGPGNVPPALAALAAKAKP